MKQLLTAFLLLAISTHGSFAAPEKQVEQPAQTKQKSDDFFTTHKIYREKVVKLPSGKEETIREEVKTSIPGEELIGVMHYEYYRDKPADNFVLTLPLAKEFIYVEGSATDEKWVWFSADGGKTFSRFKELRILDANGVPRVALGKDVTHLQWRRATPIKKGEKGDLEYHVLIR